MPLVFKQGKYARLGKVVVYHTYKSTGTQEAHHAEYDAYDVTKVKALEDWNSLWGARDAIEQSIKLVDFWMAGTKWTQGPKAWALQCFQFADDARPSDDNV